MLDSTVKMKVKIESTGYTRDLNNMAVLCHDVSVAQKYQAEMRKHMKDQKRDQEINKLKQDVADIKSMLQLLIDRGL
jgi:uncharacterized protein YceH (UPF0502 family)